MKSIFTKFYCIVLITMPLLLPAQNPLLISNPIPGGTGRSISQIVATTAGKTFFNTVDNNNIGSNLWGLWVTDGTQAGTSKLNLTYPGYVTYMATLLTPLGDNKIIFAGDNTQTYGEIWVTDGTQAGTNPIERFNTSGYNYAPVQGIASIGNSALYGAVTDDLHLHLRKTGGVFSDAISLHDFGPAQNNSLALFKAINDVCYFDFYDITTGNDFIWRSDGTVAGTYEIKDLGSSGTGNSHGLAAYFMPAGNLFYFLTIDEEDNGSSLWKSDGTTAGTTVVKKICTTYSSGNIYPSFASINDILYFRSDDGVNGSELWRTDGTGAGTYMLADINSGSAASNPANLCVLNNVLYFSATNGSTGNELWKYDPNGGSPVLIKDIFPGSTGSNPNSLTVWNNAILFSATGSTLAGNELWVSDGTAQNTFQVANLNPQDNTSSNPGSFAVKADAAYFGATADANLDGIGNEPCLFKYIPSVQPGGSLNFDGVNDHVSIPHNALLKPSAAITIEAYIKPVNIHSNTFYEIYRKEDGNDRHLFSFQNNGTILSFGLSVAGGYDELDAPVNFSDFENQWVHVAATFDGTVMKVYRNGVLIGSKNKSGAIGTSGTAPAIIGSSSGNSEFFNGAIDELSIWSKALTPAEIQNSLTCEINPATQTGLIALYHFDQGIGEGNNTGLNTLNDLSGNNLNGSLLNFALTGISSNWVSQGGVQTGLYCVPPFVNPSTKLVGTGAVGSAVLQGQSVSVSADGNTAVVGGDYDNIGVGASWIFSRINNIWTQQDNKLIGADAVGKAGQGHSVSISADGNTIIEGGNVDNSSAGAAWIFTRNNGVWIQQGNKLVGTGAIGAAGQGSSVAISTDGNTAIVGGRYDNSHMGAAWIFTRTNGVWTQQGNKLVGTGTTGSNPHFGHSVSISADGNTAIIGAVDDNNTAGAAYIFTRNNGVWSQQGNKLTGTGNVGNANQGESVSISADGTTAIIGGFADNSEKGAAWIFTRSNDLWIQQGNKLVGTGAEGNARQGIAVSVSGDGNTAIVGGYYDNNNAGATWLFTHNNGAWTQQGTKLTGPGAIGNAQQGRSVSVSADGNTAIAGGYYDNNFIGAAWIFDLSSFGIALCPGDNFNITSNIIGSQYQWQLKFPNTTDWIDLSNSPTDYFATSSATQTLTRNSIDSYWAGTQFRCRVDNSSYSSIYNLSFKSQWTGGASTLWSNAANWSCGILPDAYTDVIINSGTVVVNTNATCRSINLAPGVNFTVNPGITFTVMH